MIAATASSPLALSLGDPAGIGPEIIGKAWQARHEAQLPPFFVVGETALLSRVTGCPVAAIDSPGEAAALFDRAIPVLALPDGEVVHRPGCPSLPGAQMALHSLEIATGIVRSGGARALVTAPIAKAELAKVGFTYPGQTEFVAERCGVARASAVMMLAGPGLRVVPLTVHVALADVPGLLTAELVRARATITARGLTRNFGIAAPRLALAGLNPHAGEDGRFGSEEREILAPAVAALQADGIAITGPHPADTLFHPAARARHDAVLCCYHDQALIPLKTLHFDDGVNITLGLPIVRTSPDHGTAFDIAGKGVASPASMIAAIRMAADAAEARERADA